MTATSIALAAKSPTQIAKAVISSLQTNLPAAIAARASASVMTLPAIKTWQRQSGSPRLLHDNMTPNVTVTVPTQGLDRDKAGGFYHGDFEVEVSVYVRGANYADVQALLGEYMTAVMAALAWDRTLSGVANRMVFDERHELGTVDVADARTLGGAVVVAIYRVDRALDPFA